MTAHSNCLIFKRHLMTHLLKTIEKIHEFRSHRRKYPMVSTNCIRLLFMYGNLITHSLIQCHPNTFQTQLYLGFRSIPWRWRLCLIPESDFTVHKKNLKILKAKVFTLLCNNILNQRSSAILHLSASFCYYHKIPTNIQFSVCTLVLPKQLWHGSTDFHVMSAYLFLSRSILPCIYYSHASQNRALQVGAVHTNPT